jgi:hypothetical protein
MKYGEWHVTHGPFGKLYESRRCCCTLAGSKLETMGFTYEDRSAGIY